MALLKENVSQKSFENVRCRRIQYNIEENAELGTTKTTELVWKDYCPEAFRNIQELDRVSQADYSIVLCANEVLKEVTSPAKPGRLFFASPDERLAIKTLRKVELKGLLEMFPTYYYHLSKYPSSILIRMYGIHSVRQCGGLKVYFLVLGNTIPADASITDRYHLKGISTGRKNKKMRVENYIVQKDFDFGYRFYLQTPIREKLLEQFKADCAYLETQSRMDYCFVLSVSLPCSHEGPRSKSPHRRSSLSSSPSSRKAIDSDGSTQESGDTQLKFFDINTEPFDSNSFRFIRGLPARAVRKNVFSSEFSKEAESSSVVLYFYIADYFQKYNVIKRIEHLYKSIQHDTKSVSTINPKDYCSRFLEFAQQIFLPEDKP